MRPFRYARPTTIAELLGLLGTHGSAARLLAGGTDRLVRLRPRHIAPDVVIDVKRVGDLRADIIDFSAADVAIRAFPLTPERVCRAIPDRARAQAPHETGVEAADASPSGSPR